MTRFLCLAKLAAVLEMFDDFTSHCTIGYIEIDFTIQMNVAHNRRISIDSYFWWLFTEPEESAEPRASTLYDNISFDNVAIGEKDTAVASLHILAYTRAA